MEKRLVNEDRQRGIYRIGLDIFLIFGLPVVIGALLGTKLDTFYQTGKKITLAILAFTFVLSWIIFIIRFKKISK